MRGNFSLLRRPPRRLMSISFPAMATASSKNSAPHTFDLPLSLIAKIHAVRKVRRLKTATAVVRLAIEEFYCEGCVLLHEPHRQISVRITAAQRAMAVNIGKPEVFIRQVSENSKRLLRRKAPFSHILKYRSDLFRHFRYELMIRNASTAIMTTDRR